jgi:hypothetical protein
METACASSSKSLLSRLALRATTTQYDVNIHELALVSMGVSAPWSTSSRKSLSDSPERTSSWENDTSLFSSRLNASAVSMFMLRLQV